MSRLPDAMPAGLAGALHDGPPVEPRASASVVLVAGRRPWQLLLMRRPREVDFAAGAYVFPGGAVHAEDAETPDRLRSAAVRELFEEVGVLLARRSGRLAGPAEVSRLRDSLAAGRGWNESLAAGDLEPAFDRLTLYTRWVTPERLRRRFDTSFYLARVPSRHSIRPNPEEVAEYRWLEPAAALRDHDVPLVYATHHILVSLAAEPDAAAMIAKYRRRRRIPVVTPRVVETAAGLGIEH